MKQISEEITGVPAPQVLEETDEVMKLLHQERAQQRVAGQVVDVSVRQITEDAVKVMKVVHPEPSGEGIEEQVDVPVLPVVKRIIDVHVPQVMGEVIKAVGRIPQERVQSNTVEQIVPLIREEIGQMTQLILQGRISDCIVAVRKIPEQTVDVVNVVPQECVQQHTRQQILDVPVALQWQVPMVQKVQKTVEVPQVQYIGKIGDVSVVTQGQVPTIQTVQRTVGVPQVQFPDRVVDVPVALQTQVPVTMQEIMEISQLLPQEHILERIVEKSDVPVPCVMEEIREVEKLKSQLCGREGTFLADKKPASNLDGSCASQAPEWEEGQRFRAEELVTIRDTNKLLNDNDSLVLFKETLPSPSLMQVQSDKRGVTRRARAVVRNSSESPGEEMVSLFQRKQTDGDNKKTYCSTSVDRTEGEGERGQEEGSEQVEKDVMDWTVVTRNKRQKKKLIQIFVKVNGSKATPMEVSLNDDKVEDLMRQIKKDEDAYVTMQGKVLRGNEKLKQLRESLTDARYKSRAGCEEEEESTRTRRARQRRIKPQRQGH